MSVLTGIIKKLKSYPNNKYQIVINALGELDQMIGLTKVKQKVIEIICEAIAPGGPICSNTGAGGGNHCLVIGPPGVGKTTFIEILAKIMFGLGITSRSSKGPKFNKETFHIVAGLTFVNDQASQAMTDLKDGWTSNLPDNPRNPNVTTRLGWLMESSADLLKEYQSMLGGNIAEDSITPHIVRISRTDVIGQYHGFSAPNMEKCFEKAKGGVLMIDEAYSLLSDEEDDIYGKEVIDCLNLKMNQTDTVVILCGYKDKMKNGIFKYQQGLESRIQHVFELDIPTPFDLATMMYNKINKRSKLTVQQIVGLINDGVKIDGYGRGVEKWARQSSLVSSVRIILEDSSDDINLNDLKLGLERCGFVNHDDHSHMYT